MNVTSRRAAIYTRISSDRGGAGLGVQRQEADCRDLADRLGWAVVAVYTDNDLSAYSGKPRPGYKALLHALTGRHADAVLAWHPDRLHRHPVELEEFVDVCQQHNVAVQTVRAGAVDLATASGQMVARMLGATARYEVDHARERMKRAKADAATSGKWRGGRRPFGYAEDGVTVVEREAAALLWAANQILAGASLAATARRLTEDGLRTATGKPIDSVALRRILLRPRNAGLIDHKSEVLGQAQWPAIVPEDTWRAVVTVLKDPSRVTTSGPERVWLGSGIYRCGVCAAPVRSSLSGSTESSRAKTYVCRVNKCVVRRCADVDAVVRGVIEARLARGDLADLLARGQDPDTLAADQSEAVALRQRLEALVSMFAEGSLTRAQLIEGTKRVTDRLRAVEDRLAASAAGSSVARLVTSPDPVAAWHSAELDAQRSIVDTLLEVTILPARRGRPSGWVKGSPYFDPETVAIEWRTA